MAPIRPENPAPPHDGPDHRPARRYAVPIAAVGVTAAAIGLLPVLAGAASPTLPSITAKQLIAKVAGSRTRALTGTVQVTTDLGLPSFLSGAASGSPLGGALPSGFPGSGSSGHAADPRTQLVQLLSGTHTLRVAVDGPRKEKLSIVDDAAEYSLIHNGRDVWAYDGGSGSARHSVLPEDAHPAPDGDTSALTPQAAADRVLAAVDGTTSVTVDGTASVAGRDAYQLLVTPKQTGSTVGSIRVAIDAATGVPLRFTLTPSGGGPAAVDITFTQVSFAKPAASAFTVPKGTTVTSEQPRRDSAGSGSGAPAHGPASAFGGLPAADRIGEGWTAVAELEPGTKSPAGTTGANALPGGLGKRVSGGFGSGTLISTRLVNALITDRGTVFVGAVDQRTLTKAADRAVR